MARLSFRCDEDLVRRVDAERGLIPREAFLRAITEQALAGEDKTWVSASPVSPASRAGVLDHLAPRPKRSHASNCKCPVCK